MTTDFPFEIEPPKVKYFQFKRNFKNIRFNVAVHRHRTAGDRKFRLLISQHGTRKVDSQIGADQYVTYPLDWGDPYWYDLVVVAPHFPAANQARDGLPDGLDFNRYDRDGLQWIHDLVHHFLPAVFALPEVNRKVALAGRVELDKFYFFGQSKGGMAVHSYIMRYKGRDIHRAASCGARLHQRHEDQFSGLLTGLSDEDYLERLDAFLRTDVASIIGTCDSRERIESIRSFICREVAQRTTRQNVERLLPAPPADADLDDPNTDLYCGQFDTPAIARRDELLRTIGYRFLWRRNGEHVGEQNYRTARTYLFEGRRHRADFIELPTTLRRRLVEARIQMQLEEESPPEDDAQ